MTTYTPEAMRAQVAKVRELAWMIADANYNRFSLQSGIACGMLETAAAQLENLQTSLELTEIAYNAALDLQTTLLDRVEKLQALSASQRRLIDMHAAQAETIPKI